jgi:hypothetical protein
VNWEIVQSVAELIGAVGVIVSLIYLGNQVRQNTRAMRSATSQELLTSYNSLTEFQMTSEYGADLYHRLALGKWESVSAAEAAAYRVFIVKLLRVFEHAYIQNRAGLLAEDVWTGWRNQIAVSLAMPAFQVAWKPVRKLLSPDFVNFVESLEDETNRSAAEYVAAWEAAAPEWSSRRRNPANDSP